MTASPRRPRRYAARGLTLLEVLVAMAITVMIAVMIWAAFDQTGKMRTKLSSRQEHDHLARIALERITRDLRGSFLSLHVNQTPQLQAVVTAFVGTTTNGGARVDMTTFTHRRLRRNAHEGDACEVGYRLEEHRDSSGGSSGGTSGGRDLVRRESARIDTDPLRGGVVDVLVPDVRGFELRYWDETSDRWMDTWDTTQATGQSGRLPIRARVTLVVAEGDHNVDRVYSTETALVLTRPLTFGLPIY